MIVAATPSGGMAQSVLHSPTASTSSAALCLPVAPSLVPPTALPASLAISDDIYGDFIITEPLLIELIHSQPIQRLKHVWQHGITGLIGLTPSPAVTRYDHSVGAMLLVRRAGGSVEAQAAALLHDVAHTALSHVVDGVFNYVVHEVDKMEYLDTTMVPHIIRKHGYDSNYVLEEANFPLLELDAPAICADRLDYGLRDSVSFGILCLKDAAKAASDLCASPEGKFCFRNASSARIVGESYMRSDEEAWSNPTHSLLYRRAADTIKEAHRLREISKSHLWLGIGAADATFWDAMRNSRSGSVRDLASKVHRGVHVELLSSEEAALLRIDSPQALYQRTAKIRTIDPDILQPDGTVRRLSEVDQDYRLLREEYLARKQGPKAYRIARQ